jgi:hypothetical protein
MSNLHSIRAKWMATAALAGATVLAASGAFAQTNPPPSSGASAMQGPGRTPGSLSGPGSFPGPGSALNQPQSPVAVDLDFAKMKAIDPWGSQKKPEDPNTWLSAISSG